MKDRHGFYQDERRDTLPGPGAQKRANGDLGGQEMQSRNDGAKQVVIYIHVASAKDGSAQKAEQQQAACYEVVARLGFTVVGVYSDIGTTDRPALSRMLGEFGSTKPKIVVTLDPSRFGRRYHENLKVRTWLASAGVEAMFVQWSAGDALALRWSTLNEAIKHAGAQKAGAR